MSAASESSPELKALGRYTIERTLGTGAMGVVYEAVDPRLGGRRVAIKTILKGQLDAETAKEYSARFVREAHAVARLNHPNIVQVYDFGEEGDIAYLVMELVKGKELKSFFDANERFDLKESVRIMGELCDALDYAHNAGIIHRDIKPANVMLDGQGRTKLTDFGVARVQDSDKTVERTQAGALVGTPAYMSPEQIRGVLIDKRSDVFSAGVILYQFLTGEKPFTGSGAWTIAKKIMNEDPALPSELNNAVTALFDAVVNKALAKDPDQRFQSARDLGIALRRALEGKAEEDPDKTIAGDMFAAVPVPAKPQAAGGDTKAGATTTQELDLEFWRAIKDGNDADDFELYVTQFPTGIYTQLARRKIAKLRGEPLEDTARSREQEKKELEEAAQREAEAKAKLEAEKARLEAEMARKEEEYRKREAEAAEKARQDAAAEIARRDAEYRKREAEAETKRQAEAAELRRRFAKKPSIKQAAIAAVLLLALIGSGVYFYQQERDANERAVREANERAARAEEARRRTEGLVRQAEAANRSAADAFKRFQAAVQAEKDAQAAGDRERIRQMADARRRAEEEAGRQQKLAEAAARRADDARRSAPPPAPTAKAPVIVTPPPEPKVTEPPSASAPGEPPKPAVAVTTPTPTAGADSFQVAQNLESEGKGRDAVRAYASAAKAGNCEAARRLGQIYEKGMRDVQRDYQESLRWFGQAEKLGCKVARTTGRA